MSQSLVASRVHSRIGPRQVKSFVTFDAKDYEELPRIGIQIPKRVLDQMREEIGTFDALDPLLTTGNIPAAIQFLQQWLPGFVNIVTAPRKIDELIGVMTVGAWEDEMIVQRVMEVTGTAVPYSDTGNIPLSSWNLTFAHRSVVRFEEGMRVMRLEEARASRMGVNSASEKREGATLALDIQRNAVGFFGYNAGDNNTYGFLNDPNLSNWVVFANGASPVSPLWSGKTFQEITRDLRTMYIAVRTNTNDLIDPRTVQITLAIASNVVDYLTVTTDFGESVLDWLRTNYPNTRIVSAPELNNAHASANAVIMYAERVPDNSTDGGETWIQVVPTKFRVVGVQTMAKGYEEDYSNATAGAMCKRPFAEVRYYGA